MSSKKSKSTGLSLVLASAEETGERRWQLSITRGLEIAMSILGLHMYKHVSKRNNSFRFTDGYIEGWRSKVICSRSNQPINSRADPSDAYVSVVTPFRHLSHHSQSVHISLNSSCLAQEGEASLTQFLPRERRYRSPFLQGDLLKGLLDC